MPHSSDAIRLLSLAAAAAAAWLHALAATDDDVLFLLFLGEWQDGSHDGCREGLCGSVHYTSRQRS